MKLTIELSINTNGCVIRLNNIVTQVNFLNIYSRKNLIKQTNADYCECLRLSINPKSLQKYSTR